MPRHDAHYELTDAERRDLIKLLEQGQPLPDKYRFLLFEDKREVELVWNGKTREVCTAAEADEGGIPGRRYDFVFVDQTGFEQHQPRPFAALAAGFREHKS